MPQQHGVQTGHSTRILQHPADHTAISRRTLESEAHDDTVATIACHM